MELQAVVAFVVAYLLGSIDFGVLIPRLGGIDIYSEGSGNPGTSNVLRTMGKKAAAVVMLGDSLKGVAAAALGSLWVSEAAGFACMFAAVAGHVLPVWHRFRGGKGVATTVGGAIWLEPIFGLAVAVVWLVLVAVVKIASVASLLVAVSLVPGFAIGGAPDWGLVWAAVTSLLVLVRHRSNITRLLRGEERRVAT